MTLADNAFLYFNAVGLASESGTKVTFNMTGGVLQFSGALALGEHGTVILNQSGGTLKGGGYGANETGSVFTLNLSHGTLEGTFGGAVATRGVTTMNITGDYEWAASSTSVNLAFGFSNSGTIINQTGAASKVDVQAFKSGSTTSSGAFSTYNLSAGTLTTGEFSFNSAMQHITGTLNLVALTDGTGVFSTPTTGGTATVGNIKDYSVNVTAGTLNITGTYEPLDHTGLCLTVGSQTDANGATTSGTVNIETLKDIPLTVTGGRLDVDTITQTAGVSTISGGNVSADTWNLNDDATLKLVVGEGFNPLEIETLLTGTGTLEVSFAPGYVMDPNSVVTLIDALPDVLELGGLTYNNTTGLRSWLSGGDLVLLGEGVPEPSAWCLLALALVGLGMNRRFFAKQRK